jgi:nicotinamidase-related amidase
MGTSRTWPRGAAAILLLAVGGCETTTSPTSGSGAAFDLELRSRLPATAAAAGPREELRKVSWEARKTAFIVCDMWDDHWCRGAARRVAEMAPRLNDLLREARRRGAFVIHAPSTTTAFYQDSPARERARRAPPAAVPAPLSTDVRWGTAWCWPDSKREAALPIDDSDMGCDCKDRCTVREAWKRQIASIQIVQDADAVTDDGQEVFNLLAERGITYVVLTGVHLNMCVLGRPFGIRQMVRLGKTVALVRDLTDTMYNSRQKPFVSHFEGTDRVVEHVEAYWCPTFTSDQILGGRSFRFREDPRP